MEMCKCCRVFGTVSYYVQKLFSDFQGVRYIDTAVTTTDGDPRDHGIAASASCQDKACTQIAFKVMLAVLMVMPSLTGITASAAVSVRDSRHLEVVPLPAAHSKTALKGTHAADVTTLLHSCASPIP